MHFYDEYGYTFFEKLPESLYPRYLRKYYKETMLKKGRKICLNLKKPKTLSEKIQWLKLNDNIPEKTKFTDKLLAKDLVKAIVPEINIAQVYSIGNSFEELDFDVCPDKFVIKTNHASRQAIYIENKKDFLNSDTTLGLENIRRIINFWLSRHFAFNAGFELQYKNIQRKVFVEEYLENISEYKFMCCNGRPEAVIYINNDVCNIYNADWGKIFPEDTRNFQKQLPKPQDFDIMLEFARKLSKDFKFARVDLIKSCEKIFFGEMTFTPSSGIIEDEKFDVYMGSKLVI